MNAGSFESMLKEATSEMPPASVDARILSAIRASAKRRKSLWAAYCFPMSIAAALAILIGGAWFLHVESRDDAKLAEEGEIVLDILGLASADEFYADDSALFAGQL